MRDEEDSLIKKRFLRAEKANEIESWDEGAIKSMNARKHQRARSNTSIGEKEKNSMEAITTPHLPH